MTERVIGHANNILSQDEYDAVLSHLAVYRLCLTEHNRVLVANMLNHIGERPGITLSGELTADKLLALDMATVLSGYEREAHRVMNAIRRVFGEERE